MENILKEDVMWPEQARRRENSLTISSQMAANLSHHPRKQTFPNREAELEKVAPLRRIDEPGTSGQVKNIEQDHEYSPQMKLFCICRTPYDSTKQFIICEMCAVWYHASCVGVNNGKSNKKKAFICKDCKEAIQTLKNQPFCICRTVYDSPKLYIRCDCCQDWLHPSCVGMLDSKVNEIDEYICPICVERGLNKITKTKPLEHTHYKSLEELVCSLKDLNHAWMFVSLPDPTENEYYYEVVKEPMSLRIIEDRLLRGSYKTLSEFNTDMTLIFSNARLCCVCGLNTLYNNCSNIVESAFLQKIRNFMNTFVDPPVYPRLKPY